MTNQEAIVLLSQMYLPSFDDKEKEALSLAINTLSENIPRILSMNELQEYLDDRTYGKRPLWIEWRTLSSRGWSLDTYIAELARRFSGKYGIEWRLWTTKPDDEQRSETPWQDG